MKTQLEIVNELKLQYPELKVGSNETGYTVLSLQDYETIINQWALEQLAELTAQTEAEAKATAKTALLAQLGITEEQAKLLLS